MSNESNVVPSTSAPTHFQQLTDAGAKSEDVTAFEKYCCEMAFHTYTQQAKLLLGRVLTVIDATTPDNRQNKAVKDLIKGHFYDNQALMSHALAGGIIWESLDQPGLQ